MIVAMAGPVEAGAVTPSVQAVMRQNITPGLDRAVKLHPTDPNRNLDITVSLSLRNQPALDDLIRRVSTTGSPGYGHYLTPGQFAAEHGPTPDQVQQVSDYLRGQGLTVTSVSSNRTLVHAIGPVHAVETAFGVTISDWHDRAENRDFFGNDAQPSLPPSVNSLVVGILGLNDRTVFHHHTIRSSVQAPKVGGGPGGGYTPVELKTAYDVNPMVTRGINGTGQSLGLFELDGFNQANITTYDTNYSLATSAPQAIVVLPGPMPALGPGEIEVELDIEVMHAIAPAATITVWEGQNSASGAVSTYNAMVTSNTTSSNSTSWGDCEPDTPTSLIDTLDQAFRQAAAQGQSFFAASGDFGAYDCRQFTPASNAIVVDYPASDPFVTGVGGTNLQINIVDKSYVSESAWTTPGASPPRGTGGGLSMHWAQPRWQAGRGVSNPSSTGARQVPDVSLDADPATGYSIFATDRTPTPPATGWFDLGGTSAGAPGWAAITALYNQFAASLGRGNLGYANPALYAAAMDGQPSQPYHDITTGDNFVYFATPGWDYATGWGTPDVTTLIGQMLAARTPYRPWTAQPPASNVSPPAPVTRPWWRVPPRRAIGAQASQTVATSPPVAAIPESVWRWVPWFILQIVFRLMTFLR